MSFRMGAVNYNIGEVLRFGGWGRGEGTKWKDCST